MAESKTVEVEDNLKWPKKADQTRLDWYAHYDKLYFGEHYDAFKIKAKNFDDQYNRLRYIACNFPGMMSRIMADMMFGEKIVIDVENKDTQTWLDGCIEDNHLEAQLYESALGNSRRGDSLFKLRLGKRHDDDEKVTVIIEEITPQIYFPELDPSGGRNTAKRHVLIWIFYKDDPKVPYVHIERHGAGYIEHEIWTYNPDEGKLIAKQNAAEFGFLEREGTKVKSPLVFHIPNVRDGSGYFGTSDYKDLEQLFFALNNRITKIDNILDKHSDPILAVPPGVFDKDGKVKKEAFGMFEVNNDNPGFNKPEYIVWNANLEAAFKQIDKLLEMTFMFSEISPGTMGMDSGGLAESGRALKYKLMRTIAKRNRKIIYYDIAIKELLETAQEFGKAWNIEFDGTKISKVEKPDIKWGEGIIPDMTELVDLEVKRDEAGLSTRADSIARIDGIKPEDAKEKVKEIDEEAAITVPNLDKTTKETTPTQDPANQNQPQPVGK